MYVTDISQNQIVGYRIQNSGSLQALTTVPVGTGLAPDGITVDPRGNYVYVSNRNDSSVTGYAIARSTGNLSKLSTNGGASTQGQPGCVIVEPALGRFLYTADFLNGDVSGFFLDPNTGGLSATQGVFYGTSGLSRCVAATPHGNHPVLNSAG